MKNLLLILSASMMFMAHFAQAESNETKPAALPETERAQSGNASEMHKMQMDKSSMKATAADKPVTNIDPAVEQAGFSQGSVVRSTFTTAIDDREPVDNIDKMENDGKIYFFTELRDMSGQTAVHRWEHNGEVKAEVEFKVGGPRWRVWSSKSINPEWTGEWKVSVLNGANEVIKEKTIQLTASTVSNESAADNAMKPAMDGAAEMQDHHSGKGEHMNKAAQ